MPKHIISIIIPTYNNPTYLNPCVASIWRTGVIKTGFAELIIVNNGAQPIAEEYKDYEGIRVLTPGENLGWEKALDLAVKQSDSPFVCFQNDDTFLPQTQNKFYHNLLSSFTADRVAAVGPITTTCAGAQSIYHPATPTHPLFAPYLIFFCVMIRREHLLEVGGVDTTLPGGDDFDLSIRFNKAGYHTMINPNSFIIHHAFQTGTRVHGGPERPGGWNSQEMQDRTNKGLIQKHGFKAFTECWTGKLCQSIPSYFDDLEGFVVRSMLNGEKKILELGCGSKKTVPHAFGIDIREKGSTSPIEGVPNSQNKECVADLQADVQQPLPLDADSYDAIIARHVLEHCIDPITTITNWKRPLKKGGRLVVAVPNEKLTRGIPLNPEHCHVFTPESLKTLCETVGFKHISSKNSNNGVSFVGCFEKC